VETGTIVVGFVEREGIEIEIDGESEKENGNVSSLKNFLYGCSNHAECENESGTYRAFHSVGDLEECCLALGPRLDCPIPNPCHEGV